MAQRAKFEAIEPATRHSRSKDRPLKVGFLDEITAEVADRFEQITSLQVLTIPVSQSEQDTLPHPVPVHPVCRSSNAPEDCPETGWREHLARLREHADAHWHRCEAGHYCGVVPVFVGDYCAAACKLVCPGSTDEDAFRRNIELLHRLAEGYSARQPSGTGDLITNEDHGPTSPSEGPAALGPYPAHPQIGRAVEYISRHATDPDLSVFHVAEALDMNATYLGHLFAEQMGATIRRYIVRCRIARAKKMLAETNWQVKRVALESGYRNADWFSQVFRAETGMAPRAYRQHRRRSPP
ncbi:MAG: helix-turn-helix transcriptional regulator [Phycisphaerales bacterium]|nr:MAG: helix-turn-helix transcriptional regulator [Phycisphaerales bacterium]